LSLSVAVIEDVITQVENAQPKIKSPQYRLYEEIGVAESNGSVRMILRMYRVNIQPKIT